MRHRVWLGIAAALGSLACRQHPQVTTPSPRLAFVSECVALRWNPHPPLLEGWAIPDTVRLDSPTWLTAVPDTQGVTGGLIALAYPTPPNEATWSLKEHGLELWFRTVYGFRRLTFPGPTPFGQARWDQSVEFDYRLSGKVFGRRVSCPTAAS